MKLPSVLLLALFSAQALASLLVYERPSDEVVFAKSEFVAIVRTISGEVIPISKNGGVRVKAKVLYPIKGARIDEVIDIFYGASSIGGRYLATLVWDEELGGYRYYDSNYDFELYEVPLRSGSKVARTRGFEGEAIPVDDVFYLPVCSRKSPVTCQFVFEHLQFMLGRVQ